MVLHVFCHSICSCFPTRYRTCLLACMCLLIQYTMRICLHLAITEMTFPPTTTAEPGEGESRMIKRPCFSLQKRTEEPADPIYNWSEKDQGVILSSFYWGYMVSNFSASAIADRFPRLLLMWSVFGSGVLTLLTPMAIDKGGMRLLVCLRACEGFFQGVTFPVLSALISHWVPPAQRSMLGAFVYSGSQIGSLVGGIGSGMLIHYFNSWRIVFYVWGTCAMIMFLTWWIFVFDSPHNHPYMDEGERSQLIEELGGSGKALKPGSIPWRKIASSAPFWAVVFGQVSLDFNFYLTTIDLPKFMKSTLGLDVRENGIISYMPFFLMWMNTSVTGWIADKQIKSGCLSRTNTRKFWCTCASTLSSTFILAAAYSGCRKWLIVACFTLAIVSMSGYYPSVKVNANDLSPNFAGLIMAFVNGFGGFCGIIVPYMVGLLTPNQTIEEWRLVFWIGFFVILTSTTIFNLFSSGEVQSWNTVNE
ncbi:sialin-like [Uranotaenia lowii]|uniref:sialin-like n=1 Tax=Uranotaenia lowii TaxID=190385 RepID=UPI0024795AC6|nr:sialin-like [Uranotaenia lowii]